MIALLGALAFVLTLAMESGQADTSRSTTTSGVPTTTSASATSSSTPTTFAPATSILAKWCGLNLGDSRQQVENALGKGIEVTRQELNQMGLPATYSAERWPNENGFLLLTTWDGASVTALQAYPYGGGAGLPCEQFRATP